ncbi:winged helix-turn-helix domain-containing protein [Sandarakinorhabdus oryzae]|uniref:winged helix-turn-helix domain-containing protein n=1 Tax=Sandarakinorhabdus oryzae TaxID=2675220 RepID=UPI0012E0F532|nr:winged helix-turn-helix domain-containing protein [Sandarakinorhabdus oryzae]
MLVLGDLALDASARTITGPIASCTLEPQVMRVFQALAATPGTVHSREQLLERCWDGVFVGEDSLNRAIAAIRRALRESGTSQVEIETLSKTGYRLRLSHGDEPPAALPATSHPHPTAGPASLSRRALLVASGAVAAGAAAWWAWDRSATQRRTDALVTQARDQWRLGNSAEARAGIAAAEQAVAIDPAQAAAWGMLAVLQREWSENGPAEDAQRALERCLAAIAQALELDGDQGEALAARAMIPPIFGDWWQSRLRLQAVLRQVPDQPQALDALGLLQGSTGAMADALATSERQAANDPLAAVYQHKLIYRLWANGRLRDMDRAADRAITLWPTHFSIWMARMWTYGYTGRADAALRMLEEPMAARNLPPPLLRLFRTTETALGSQRAGDIAAAVDENRKLAAAGIGPAVMAIQHLAVLGAADAALAVARGFLAGEGQAAVRLAPDPRYATSLNEQHRRKTLVLFIPATANLRAHPGFMPLVERIGMADYWAKAGVTPDFRALGKRSGST